MSAPTKGSGSPLRAVAYARVSLLLKQDPGLQLVNIRQFAQARGFELVNEYVDRVHGDRDRRPGLDRLIADARMGKFKVIICTAIDRMFRSTKHMLNLVDELRHYGVSIISIREQLDFTTPAGQMSLTVLAAVATLEKQIIGERIKTSLAAKKLASERAGVNWRCGRPGKVADDELVREVLAIRESGKSARAIEKILEGRARRTTIQIIINNAERKDRKGVKNQGIGDDGITADFPHHESDRKTGDLRSEKLEREQQQQNALRDESENYPKISKKNSAGAKASDMSGIPPIMSGFPDLPEKSHRRGR